MRPLTKADALLNVVADESVDLLEISSPVMPTPNAEDSLLHNFAVSSEFKLVARDSLRAPGREFLGGAAAKRSLLTQILATKSCTAM